MASLSAIISNISRSHSAHSTQVFFLCKIYCKSLKVDMLRKYSLSHL